MTIRLTAKKRPEYFSWDSLEDSSWTLSTDDRGAPERHISARGSQCALPQAKEAPKFHMKKCEENYRQMRDGGRAAGFHGLPGGLGGRGGGVQQAIAAYQPWVSEATGLRQT